MKVIYKTNVDKNTLFSNYEKLKNQIRIKEKNPKKNS